MVMVSPSLPCRVNVSPSSRVGTLEKFQDPQGSFPVLGRRVLREARNTRTALAMSGRVVMASQIRPPTACL